MTSVAVYTFHQFALDHDDLLKIASHFAMEKGTCLLLSGTAYETASRSFLFLYPYDVNSIHGDRQERFGMAQPATSVLQDNPWDALEVLGLAKQDGLASFPEWVC